MSVYKVISNYYNDLLTFLSDEDKAANGLANMFRDITADKKKIIITKLTDMMVKFDAAFANEINFWNSQNKDQTLFIIIYIIMITSVIGIVIALLVFRIKRIKSDDPDSMFKISKISLNCLIISQIIVTIFFILIINIRATKKLCKGQILLLKEDNKSYSEYIFEGATRGRLSRFFTLMGYWQRNSKIKYMNLYKEFRLDNSYVNILSVLNINPNDKNNISPNDIGKEVEIYDKLKNDIEQSLIRFYNGGKGFIDVKKKIMLASPILILKEAKRIMNYYNFLAYKKPSDEKQVNKDDDVKNKTIINDQVITPISDLVKNFDNSNIDINPSELARLIILNNNDINFKKNMNNLIKAFDYLIIFMYPIYIKVFDNDPSFPLPEILPNMPNLISTYNESTDSKEFLEGLKSVFIKIYNNKYRNCINSAKKINDTDALNSMLILFIPLYGELYNNVFMYLQGGNWFPFNKKYITSTIQETLILGMASSLPLDYRIIIIDLIFDSLITPIGNNFDILIIKKSYLIDSISDNLLLYKLNLIKYQNYIINSLIQKNDITKNYVDDIIELLNQISKSIITKKQFRFTLNDSSNEKFIEPDDFIDMIKDISYNEFTEGLNIDFYKDVIDKFYANISESVNLKTPNLRNIYYSRQTAFKIWKLSIIMIIIALVLILIRFTISTLGQGKNIIYNKPLKDCNEIFTFRDFSDRSMNWYIKLALPIFVLFFIIAMLISFHKKIHSTFEFNLEIIENNTNELKNLLDEFDKELISINNKINNVDKSKQIGLISSISVEDKKKFFEFIKKIIDKFEKCNYIIESSKSKIPFPYTEVIMSGFIFLLIIVCIFFIIFQYSPIKKFKDNKYLNKLKEELIVTENINVFSEKLKSIGMCHDEDMSSITYSIKIIFAIFIVLFLIFYSIKIITSANDFKLGLYNSAFFEESKCYNN